MTTDHPNISDELRPVLGEIARQWQRLHPRDLNAPEALRLLGVLTEITDRVDASQALETVVGARPVLRLVVDNPEKSSR